MKKSRKDGKRKEERGKRKRGKRKRRRKLSEPLITQIKGLNRLVVWTVD